MRQRSYETKENIIAAAKCLFFEFGYNGSSIDKIAEMAHITKKTLYGYFPDKKTLLLEVINDSIGVPWVFNNPVENMSNHNDLHKILVIIAKGLNDVYSNPDYVGLLRMLISEANSHPELSDIMAQGITKRAFDLLSPILIEANKKDIVSIVNPIQRSQSFVGGLLYDFYVNGLLAPYPGTVRRYSDLEILEYVSTTITPYSKNSNESVI